MAELFLTDLQKNFGMLKYKNKKDTWEEVTWKSGLCP